MTESTPTWSQTPKFYKRTKNRIEAVRVFEDNVKDVAKWCGGEAQRIESNKYVTSNEVILKVPTLGDPLSVCPGEWLIKNEEGRYSVMDNKKFMVEYEYEQVVSFALPQCNTTPGARNVETY